MSSEKERIALSERWTKIATILPNAISSSTNHPALYVDPNGFRRVVTKSLITCERFLNTLQKIEDGLEKRINGITSYYSLVVAPNRQSSLVRNYGGMVSISGSTISIDPRTNYLGRPSMQGGYASRTPSMNMALDSGYQGKDYDDNDDNIPSEPQSQPQSQPRQESVEKKTKTGTKTTIFQKIGDIILCNDRRIADSEVISFNRGLEILVKLDNLREVTINCITSFGALDEILQVGKVFSYRTEAKTEYYGEHAIDQRVDVKEDMMQLSNYWGILACVNRIRNIEKKLAQPMKSM